MMVNVSVRMFSHSQDLGRPSALVERSSWKVRRTITYRVQIFDEARAFFLDCVLSMVSEMARNRF